jgi:glycosyltransferase involved in cell wall biosynthesis
MQPDLSICIPTHNRAIYLREALQSIFESVKGYEDRVELVISDNASTDETAAIVKGFQRSYPMLRYMRNEKDIGGNRNCAHIARMATGSYVWVFGDDDKVAPDAIPMVLKKIRSGHNLIICNFATYTESFARRVRASFYSPNARQRVRDHNELLATYHLTLGYVSCVVMHKSVVANLLRPDFDQYIDYGFPLLHAIYAGVSNHCDAALIPESIVLNRSAKNEGFNWCEYYVRYPASIFETLKQSRYSSSSVRAAKNGTILEYIFPQLVRQKSQGQSVSDIYRGLRLNYRDCWTFWLLCLPVGVTPGVILRVGRTIHREQAMTSGPLSQLRRDG